MGICRTSPVNSRHIESGVLPLALHRKSCVLKCDLPLNCTCLPLITLFCDLHMCHRIQNILRLINCPNIQCMPALIPFLLPTWVLHNSQLTTHSMKQFLPDNRTDYLKNFWINTRSIREVLLVDRSFPPVLTASYTSIPLHDSLFSPFLFFYSLPQIVRHLFSH